MKPNVLSKIAIASLMMAFSVAQADIKSDKANVEASCTQEAATAGCGQDKVGTGLLKCIHAYHKAHKDFKLSDACHASMKQLHQDRKEKKEEKK